MASILYFLAYFKVWLVYCCTKARAVQLYYITEHDSINIMFYLI